jgi:hypothetical protein
MHTVVVRRDLAARHPDLVANVYRAFCEAKDVVLQEYRTGRIFNHMDVPMPWNSALYDHDVEVFGEDWWPYGLGANRITVDAFLRWHHEQGLSRRRMTCGEVFASELLHT